MARAAVVTEAKIERVVSALQKHGVTISGCVITATEVRLEFGEVDGRKEKPHHDGPEPWDDD